MTPGGILAVARILAGVAAVAEVPVISHRGWEIFLWLLLCP